MCNSGKPLEGKTIVFTGSTLPADAAERVEELGGSSLYLPLIETSIRQTDKPDFLAYGWLIFTSRTSAEAFCQLQVSNVPKIAAVGEKTAEVLQQNGYQVDFIPTVYSADWFVKEFPSIAEDEKCLFIKGALAKSTIASMPLPVDEWIIYDTALKLENAIKLKTMKHQTIIFASPSAVSAYRKAGGDWRDVEIAAIGHITEKAIKNEGGHVDFVPADYTYFNVVNEIAKGRCKE
ncbi:uroporphyrinogen-III synthase [Planococcus sp. CAU13]|uniref:uroporphyrinogen-III synthase n=1 Tax=Planococcus sp. CAU13 TaxID=1541197 RepID=UPI00052FFD5C|nr:uroporphyrinogen-III synthase [Planococcus sp. CAU13]